MTTDRAAGATLVLIGLVTIWQSRAFPLPFSRERALVTPPAPEALWVRSPVRPPGRRSRPHGSPVPPGARDNGSGKVSTAVICSNVSRCLTSLETPSETVTTGGLGYEKLFANDVK